MENKFKIMFIIEFMIGLTIAVFIFLRCDSGTSPGETVVGKWIAVETGDETTQEIILEIQETGTYLMLGNLRDESLAWLVLSEKGIWEQNGNVLFFYPSECKKIDFETGNLEIVDCTEDNKLSIKKNILTDGNVEFHKKQ